MIRVTVEMVPKGTGKPRVVATARIWNTGKGTRSRGSYRAVFYTVNARGSKVWRKSWVHDFRRLSCGAWSLIKKALENTA